MPVPVSTKNTRNVGIIAHIDAGKTTFTERVLFYSKTIGRMGEVHDGSATMDFLSAERERGISIAAASVSLYWGDCMINLIDTPGHVDFSMEVERSLRVLDGAVGVFCGINGVEAQSEQVWRQSERYKIPKLALVNKMDREGADYDAVLLSMRENLKINPLPLTIPQWDGEKFKGILDLVRQETLYFDPKDFGQTVIKKAWNTTEAEYAAPYLDRLIDVLTELDDELLGICLSGKNPAPELLEAVLRKGTINKDFVPVFATAVFRNIGVQPVIDGICKYLPSPLDRPAVKGTLLGKNLIIDKNYLAELKIKADENAGFCAFVFKKSLHEGKRIAFIRVYSGTLKKNQSLIISRSQETFKADKIYRVFASSFEEVDQARAGDILAIEGINASTGDTLVQAQPLWILDPVLAWAPVISQLFEPRNDEEGQKLDEALSIIAEEDPSLVIENRDGLLVVSGLGELHLDILRQRLKEEFKLNPRVGNPQVVVVESPASESEIVEVQVNRKVADKEIKAYVKLKIRPGEAGADWVEEELAKIIYADKYCSLSDAVKGNIQAAILAACESSFSGLPVRRLRVDILELGLSSNEDILLLEEHLIFPGLYMASQEAVKEALKNCGTKRLEPYMKLGIAVPAQYMGACTALLNSVGAKIKEITDRVDLKHISAEAPMRALFSFSTRLRSQSQGRASMTIQFSGYADAED